MKFFKIRTPHINKDGMVFSWASLLFGFGLSVLLPILPNFIKTVVNNDAYVGYFYSSMSLAMLLAGLLSAYLFKKFSRISVLKIFFIIGALAVMFFIFATKFYHIFFLEFTRIFSALIITISLSLMVRDFTAEKNLGRTEGVFFVFNNIGWFLGPLIGGVIGRYAGFEPVFMLSGTLFLISLAYILHQNLIKKHPSLSLPKYEPKKIIKTGKIKRFFSDKGRVAAYAVHLTFVTWLVFKSVLTPLYITNQGYGSDMAGLVISLSMLPYVLIELPVGKYADKHGVRNPIVCGFAIIAMCLFGVKISPIFFIDAALLVIVNVGSAFIEPLCDFFFFKHVSKEEENDLYGIFRTADPIGKFAGPLIFSASLMFLPFDWVFVVSGTIFLIAGVAALRIKD